jgi:hypothetical protein
MYLKFGRGGFTPPTQSPLRCIPRSREDKNTTHHSIVLYRIVECILLISNAHMLALKKKREAEAKAKAEAEAAAASSVEGAVQSPGSAPSSASGGAATESSSNKVSLLGVGGKKKKADGAGVVGNGQKKRSPGEIRIQKGELGCEWLPYIAGRGGAGCVRG